MNIIFDLDGTLIDSRRRLYALFQFLVPESRLSYEAYWNFKMNRVSNERILSTCLGYCPSKTGDFRSKWLELIETDQFLWLDQPIPGICETLRDLQQHAKLHLCTARQRYSPVIDQLKQLRIIDYFESVMVTLQTSTKQELIIQNVNIKSVDWIVGDTGKDIQVGRDLGVKTCAVLSGFLNQKSLEAYAPDIIIDSIACLTTRLLIGNGRA